LLFISGLVIYFLGRRLEWSRHAKIVVGLAIALTFIIFSALLCADTLRCPFPFFSWMKASEFMFHTNLTGITKSDVPEIIVAFLFLLYPIWIFAGYLLALLIVKKRRFSKEIYTYSDVKSRNKNKVIIDEKDASKPIKTKTEGETSTYAVTRGNDTKKCVRDAVNALGGIGKFVKNGDKVLVKINICGGVPEIKGSYTSTVVAEELVDLIRSAGGEPTLADADMIWTKFWQAAKDSGWMDWAKKKGVRLLNLSETKIVNFDFGMDSNLGLERVSMEAIDADVIISVPTMKTHLLTGVTLGMKNMYGTFPDVDKAKYHRKGIERTIYEVNKAFTPCLVVIDGSIGGEAVGPLSTRPLSFETIIASNDVVMADSIACQIMGYDPMDVTHIRIAQESGLGNASAKFDLDRLPYSHPGGKDGNWERPDPSVKDFYEWGIELLMKLPGWETLFNIGADFFLYDLARMPVFRYLTPTILQFMNDVVYLNLKDLKDNEQDTARRKTNIAMVLLIALAFVTSYIAEGYVRHSSLIFELSYLVAIIVALVAAVRMKTKNLAALLLISALVSVIVEHTNISSGLLAYAGSSDVSLFVVSGWMLMMVVILQLSDLLMKWFPGLGIFKNMQGWNNLPFILTFMIFALFFYWEGYLAIAGREVLGMYAVMAVIGLIYSWRHSIEWNVSITVVGLAIGGYMELLGSLAGFWQYHFIEPLAISFVLTWPINAWAIHGLIYLMGIDLGAYEERYLLPKRAG
jgi:uncharacterized protein (DUF362 family)